MPRYEFIEGSSKKFWEISLEGTSFTTTYGRIGTDGQTSMKEFDSEAKADTEYKKLITEKTKKGYVLVDGAGAAAKPAAPAPAAPVAAAAVAAAPAAAKKKAAVFEDEGDDEEDEAPKKAVEQAAAPAPAPKAAGASRSGDSGARYFEFVDGGSAKFWEIKLEGKSYTTRYGKIGTDGQVSMKEYDSDDKAKREYEKIVAEKTKKGYAEK